MEKKDKKELQKYKHRLTGQSQTTMTTKIIVMRCGDGREIIKIS